MNNVALVTGASSGIGKELARIHAARKGDLVIVARRQDALEELRAELSRQHGVSVHCISADLTEPKASQEIFDELATLGIEIEYLVNNAGFGGHGLFHEREWETDRAMIQLNITALTELTRLFLPTMIQRQSGRILNVASTAGFIPGPLQAVYYATKAYVVSFSQAIAEELRHEQTGVTVTALCPGPVATEFAEKGNLEELDAFRNAKSPRSVAEIGYDAMLRGKLIAINEFRLKFLLNCVMPFLPRSWILKMSRKMMEK